jgi:hypothetical protein
MRSLIDEINGIDELIEVIDDEIERLTKESHLDSRGFDIWKQGFYAGLHMMIRLVEEE